MAEQSLFRQEVLEAQLPTTIGTIRLATPLSLRLWAGVGVTFAISLCAWLSLGQYTRRETVMGTLVPQAGLITLTARGIGTISGVAVQEGSVVKAGEAVAYFSSERHSAALGDTEADVSSQLRLQQDRLQVDVEGAQQLADVQASDLRAQDVALNHQLAQLDAQIATAQQQVSELSSLLARFEGLGNKGFVSAIEVQQQRSQKAAAVQQMQALARQRAELLQQQSSVRHQLAELPILTAAKRGELLRQLAQVRQSLAQNEADRVSVLRAPSDGDVSAILVKQGQAVTPGQAVASLVPQGSLLQVQLWVPSRAVGFVHVGTPVVLRYAAFPFQKFGAQHGTVITVSRSALSPADLSTARGQAVGTEALYRVDVALDSQRIDVYGHPEALKPGMAVEADLLLDKRRMIEWIFEPLYGLYHRGTGAEA